VQLRVITSAACALSAPRMTAARLSHDPHRPACAHRQRLPQIILPHIIQ